MVVVVVVVVVGGARIKFTKPSASFCACSVPLCGSSLKMRPFSSVYVDAMRIYHNINNKIRERG